MNQNQSFTVLGPSGAGKTSIINAITKNRATTTTSRKIRSGEVNGVDYFFKTNEEFEKMIRDGAFVEWAKYGKEGNEHYYGLTYEEYHKRLALDDLFIVCSDEGVKHYKKNLPDVITIFIYADFEDVCRQLQDRGGALKDIEERMSLYNEEMKGHILADVVIKNRYNDFEGTVENLKKIIEEVKRVKRSC